MNLEFINTIHVLNKLLNITRGRVGGYRKAAEEETEANLKSAYRSMVAAGNKNASELVHEITKSGGTADPGPTQADTDTYIAWMDFKSIFTGKDRQSVLSSGKYGEEASEQAFFDVIDCKEISADIRQLIRNQQSGLATSYALIRSYHVGQKED
ncbi:MAG: PA2169 family four-helix-bundle protein [Cytophagales bacterium]|nr:PA2169 family four-helix-bundle protein [Cytophagales bacterium]